MPAQPYSKFRIIEINDQQPFYGKVVALLDIIDGMPIGKKLLNEIQAAGKKVIITTSPTGTNKCTSGGSALFVRLRQAFRRGEPPISIAEELSHTLDEAEKSGFSRMNLCKLIVNGLTPATLRTSGNLAHPAVAGSPKQQLDRAFQLSVILGKVTSGQLRYDNNLWNVPGPYMLDDYLVRLLRPWLRSGSGSGSRIDLNPDGNQSCVGEKGMQWRPPGIGLAHELVHAWRNSTGNRLFDDAVGCSVDDDEIMTTGIPPYMEGKFTENHFRVAWPLTTWEKWRHWVSELPVREGYR